MITFSKVKSSTIEFGKRIMKLSQFGTKTAKEVGPFGFDSSAPEDLTAIFSETTNKDESIIIGYINKNQVAQVGESRMYAINNSGEVVSYIFCRANGTTEIMGNEFSAVRYENLEIDLNSFKDLINAELSKISVSIGSLGGVYTELPLIININNSKSENVKIK